MTHIMKRAGAWVLLTALLIHAFPSAAAEPVEPENVPAIVFASPDLYDGLPVIYAQDLGQPALFGTFTGFTVEGGDADEYVDITFVERKLRLGQGTVEIVYSAQALNGFCAPAAGVVTIVAVDSQGKVTRQRAWCEVRDTTPPSYANNQLPFETNQDEPLVFSAEMMSQGLVETAGLFMLHIVQLPVNGTLEFAGVEGTTITMTEQILPYALPVADIGSLRYVPALHVNGTDTFGFYAEDTRGNRAEQLTTATISVTAVNLLPAITGLPGAAVSFSTGDVPVTLRVMLQDQETPSGELVVQIVPDAGQTPNAQVSAIFIAGDEWALVARAQEGSAASCGYTLTITDAQGAKASAHFVLDTTHAQWPVMAQDDVVLGNGQRSLLFDVLENDTAPGGEALALLLVGKPTLGSAVIEGGRIRFTYPEGATGTEPVRFTYTLAHDGASNDADKRTAIVYLNDATPPAIQGLGVTPTQGWAQSTVVSARVADDLGVAIVQIKPMDDANATPVIAQRDARGAYTATIQKNGAYLFEALDHSGNTIQVRFYVTNVDSTAPTAVLENTQAVIGGHVGALALKIAVSDENGSGVQQLRVERGDGSPLAGAEVANGGAHYLVTLAGCVLNNTTVALIAVDGAGNEMRIDLGELTLDILPPAIAVEGAILPEQAVGQTPGMMYYVPRALMIQDEGCGLAEVLLDGTPLAEDYLLPMRLGSDAVHTIIARDVLGNEQSIQVTMRGVPDPAAIALASDPAALLEATAAIRAELNALAPPMEVSAQSRADLVNTIDALELEAEMLQLLQGTSLRTEERNALVLALCSRIEDTPHPALLAATLREAFDAFVLGCTLQDIADAVDMLPADPPAIPNRAFLTSVEDAMVALGSMTPQQRDELDETRRQKLYALYGALLSMFHVQNTTDDGSLQVLGMLTRLEMPLVQEGEEYRVYLATTLDGAQVITPELFPGEYRQAERYSIKMLYENQSGVVQELAVLPGEQLLVQMQVGEVLPPQVLHEQASRYKWVNGASLHENGDKQAVSVMVSAMGSFYVLYDAALPTPDDYVPQPAPESTPAPNAQTPTPESAPTPTPNMQTPAPVKTPEPTPSAQPTQTPQITPQSVPSPTSTAKPPSASPTASQPKSSSTVSGNDPAGVPVIAAVATASGQGENSFNTGAVGGITIPAWPPVAVLSITAAIVLAWIVVTLRRMKG